MDLSLTPRAAELLPAVRAFMERELQPVEQSIHHDIAQRRSGAQVADPWEVHPKITELRAKARGEGLWNLFLPAGHGDRYAEKFGTRGGRGLSNTDYAPLAEQMGSSFLAPLIFNCNAPDTGNMEVILKYGSPEQQERWLEPLLDGKIRSAYLMTEPDVASSDATNMAATATIDGDEVVLNGRKWWSSGAGHPDCGVYIYMALTDQDADRHHRHTMVLVPADAPGVTRERNLQAFGVWDEPLGHSQILMEDVRLPASNIIAGPGRAYEIAQGRLGPGRVHHCMRLIGLSEMALELACRRGLARTSFGKPVAKLGGNTEKIAQARNKIDMARLLVLDAAWKLDTHGIDGARVEVSQIKAAVPQMACEVIDLAVQLHGGAGMSQDTPLAAAYSLARSLRLADGPDEVHLMVVGRYELAKYRSGN